MDNVEHYVVCGICMEHGLVVVEFLRGSGLLAVDFALYPKR